MSDITVIKRSGKEEPLDVGKWQAQVAKVCQGIADVSQSMINLVCSFEPEPVGENHGYLRIINLLLRDDYERISHGLGIEQPFAFGFVMDCEVFLPSGKTMNSLEDGLVLWTAEERSTQQ